MRDWRCLEFLTLKYADLNAVENSDPVHCDLLRLLLGYGLSRTPLVALEYCLALTSIGGAVLIPKELDRDSGNDQQKTDKNCGKGSHAAKSSQQCFGSINRFVQFMDNVRILRPLQRAISVSQETAEELEICVVKVKENKPVIGATVVILRGNEVVFLTGVPGLREF